MNSTPQPMIVGSQGGWAIALVFLDGLGNAVDLGKAGLVAVADFYQPNLARTTSCKVLLTDPANGRGVALVPQDVVLSTLQPPPSSVLLGSASIAPAASPCRLHAYVVDGQAIASAHLVAALQPVDPRIADLSSIPAAPALAVVVGPAGGRGEPGADGAPGPAGSADPQLVALAGAVVQHQALFLGPAGGLVASCDQPGHAGRLLGLSLAAGALGDEVQYSAAGVVADPSWTWLPGPIFLGLGGALTQKLPAAAAFVQQVATAISATSIRMGLRRPVMLDLVPGYDGPTYRDLADGVEHLRPAAVAPGSPDTLIATAPDGYFPTALLAPVAVGASRLAGGPHLASLPNGCFEDGLDGWSVSRVGTAEVEVDPNVSAVGRRSAYLHCPTAGDVAAIASSPVPCGEGVPVYVATRAMLRSGTALAVLSAIFYDRNGAALGQPAQVGTPLRLGPSFAEFGAYLLPPAGARYGAAAISNAGTAGAVGAINVDELMMHRQIGGPAAWQVKRAAQSVIAALGGTMGAFLAMFGDAEAADGTGEASEGAVPAPIGGILYATLSLYLQKLGLQEPDLTRQLVATWSAATPITPMPPGTPLPPPIVVSAKTSQVISAVRPVLTRYDGAFSKFVTDYIGDGDAVDRSWEALYVDPVAPIGGVLYSRLLQYLTAPAPAGLGKGYDQSNADLAAAWAAAPGIPS